MTSKLIAEEGTQKGLTLELSDGQEWVIGRDPDLCQFAIEDPSTSRTHLVCRASPEGIVAENLSQTNPVVLNDKELIEPSLLKNGDALRIGSAIFRFYEEDKPESEKEDELTPDTSNKPRQSEDGDPADTQSDVEENPLTPPEEELESISEQKSPPPEKPLQTESSPLSQKEGEEAKKAHEFPEEEPEHDSIYEETEDETSGILAEINFNVQEAGRWLLKVIGGPNNGAEFSMHSEHSYLIGNDPTSCDIVFHDTSVSRQHARITIDPEQTITLEDLGSRNGTLIESSELHGSSPLKPNTIVTLGTTSFLVFDREGEMQTIISPMLPSIVQMLKKKEEEKLAKEEEKREKTAAEKEKEEQAKQSVSPLVLVGIVSFLFIAMGIGTTTLFQTEPLQKEEQVDMTQILQEVFLPFPSVEHHFAKNSGRLLLIGHVLRQTDKNQLLNQIEGLPFVKSVDESGLVIDELVWRETNQIMQRDPRWRGINVQSPAPGRFILSGYLNTRQQATELADYMTANFPYLDRLEYNVIVEENVINQVDVALDNEGLRQVEILLENGELLLTGRVPKAKQEVVENLISQFKQIPGIRKVKTFLNQLEQEQSLVNLTGRYLVTGFARGGAANISVVIDGKILTKGDILDGMTITNINQRSIFLEKDGTEYRIDYN